jgi:hypothetical protein
MDHSGRMASRRGKRYFRLPDSGPGNRDESKYLLDLDDDTEADVGSRNNNFRGRNVVKPDAGEDGEILVAVPGRPPLRPPNDQCVEAEVQPDDTLASISLRVRLL